MNKAIPTTAAYLSPGDVIIVSDTDAHLSEVLAVVTHVDRHRGMKNKPDYFSVYVIPLNLTEAAYGRHEDEFDRTIHLDAFEIVHLAGHLSTPAIQHLVRGN